MIKVLVVLFSCCTCSMFAQNSNRFILEGGLVARVTVLHYRASRISGNNRSINTDAPYLFERGVNGWGLNVGMGYVLSKKHSITIRETSTFRYAFYYFDHNSCSGCVARTPYFDQSFFLSKSAFQKRGYYGAGFTMFSIGKELNYYANSQDKTLPLHFNSIDLLVGYPIWKLFAELKFSYVDHGFPGRARRNAQIIGGRLYYRFKFKEKKKP